MSVTDQTIIFEHLQEEGVLNSIKISTSKDVKKLMTDCYPRVDRLLKLHPQPFEYEDRAYPRLEDESWYQDVEHDIFCPSVTTDLKAHNQRLEDLKAYKLNEAKTLYPSIIIDDAISYLYSSKWIPCESQEDHPEAVVVMDENLNTHFLAPSSSTTTIMDKEKKESERLKRLKERDKKKVTREVYKDLIEHASWINSPVLEDLVKAMAICFVLYHICDEKAAKLAKELDVSGMGYSPTALAMARKVNYSRVENAIKAFFIEKSHFLIEDKEILESLGINVDDAMDRLNDEKMDIEEKLDKKIQQKIQKERDLLGKELSYFLIDCIRVIEGYFDTVVLWSQPIDEFIRMIFTYMSSPMIRTLIKELEDNIKGFKKAKGMSDEVYLTGIYKYRNLLLKKYTQDYRSEDRPEWINKILKKADRRAKRAKDDQMSWYRYVAYRAVDLLKDMVSNNKKLYLHDLSIEEVTVSLGSSFNAIVEGLLKDYGMYKEKDYLCLLYARTTKAGASDKANEKWRTYLGGNLQSIIKTEDMKGFERLILFQLISHCL
jgi:hypothetical protein